MKEEKEKTMMMIRQIKKQLNSEWMKGFTDERDWWINEKGMNDQKSIWTMDARMD